MSSSTHNSTCWVVYFDRPDSPAATSPGLAPVAVTSTEQEALELLEQLLSSAPGRTNLVEDYPFSTSARELKNADDARDKVHLVITADDGDGPTVSEVFDSIGGATRHAEALRRHGEDCVFITDMVMNTVES